MLRRLEIPEMPLVCEWDSSTGLVQVAFGGQHRELAWSWYQALNDALIRETGAVWVTEQIRERVQTRCFGNAALFWEATFTPVGSAEYVPAIICAAAGVSMETLESGT